MSDPSPIQIFDRARLKAIRRHNKENLQDFRFLADWSERELYDRLRDINRSYDKAIYSSAFTPSKRLINEILKKYSKSDQAQDLALSRIHNLYYFDLCGHSSIPQIPSIMGDEEVFPFAQESLDLIISNLHLHSTNDLPGTLIQMKRALKPDGLFLGAMFGGQSLHELRQCLMMAEEEMSGGVSPRIFPFADKQDMGGLLQRAGYNLPVVDSEIVSVTYDNIFSLMKDLKGMAEQNIILKRQKGLTRRDLFMKAGEYYQKHFAGADGRIIASFEIIFLLGWAPHASQQKPLAPGSAKERLAEVLKTEEIKTGDFPA